MGVCVEGRERESDRGTQGENEWVFMGIAILVRTSQCCGVWGFFSEDAGCVKLKLGIKHTSTERER